MTCPLCQSPDKLIPVMGADQRLYVKCLHCFLIFTNQYLTREEEEARYKTHQNGPQHEGHVKFLYRAITPALLYIDITHRGLDYGCGPVPTLSFILRENHNIACDDYDPIFHPELPSGKYDFIFSTECFEHFFSPAKEIARIKELLKPEGLLIVMTELWNNETDLATWYYFRDTTHVAFFHTETFRYIAKVHGFERIPCQDERVVILRNKGAN